MRILIHDYGGYAFSVQLSRELARRGHDVQYLYGDSTQLVKRGKLEYVETDDNNFSVYGIKLSKPFKKYSLLQRRFQEVEYGKLLVKMLDDFQPDVVVSANTPLDAQAILFRWCLKNKIDFIFWLQDLIGLATYQILRKERFAWLAGIIGRYYMRLECRLLQRSAKIVAIADDFMPILNQWGINQDRIQVIQNWAPIEEIPVHQKDNSWARENGLADKLCFLYTGVLGMKHNPELLVQLAQHFQHDPQVCVCVISEGPGAEWLHKKKNELAIRNLKIVQFQPYNQFPNLLASADVLLAILTPDAGAYSVPSKVYSYLCAQRPILLAVPEQNLVAQIVSRHKAGIAVLPNDVDSFLMAAEKLVSNPSLRGELANNARIYAEEHFNIQKIGDQFQTVLM